MTSYIKQNFESGHSLEAKELSYSEKGLEQSFRIIEKLCPPLILEDNFISCFPLKGAPLNPKSKVKLIQEGEGEPYPKGEGRNLIPFPYATETKEGAGIIWTNNQDGSITIKGTSTGYSMFTLSTKLNLEDGKTYYFSKGTYLYINYLNENGEERWGISTLTWKNTYTFKSIYLQIDPNKTVDKTVWPYLNEGSLDPEWTPYANIREITGWNAATVTRCGKNLFNLNTLDYITHSNTTIVSGDILTSTFVNGSLTLLETKLHIPGTYTLTISPIDSFGAAVLFYTENRAETLAVRYIQQRNTPYVVTVTLDKPFIIGIGGLTKNYGTYSYRVQLEYGSAATAYEPYQGNTYTAQFPETIYGGYYDWSAGALVITHEGKILDNVSETQETQWFIGGDTPKNKYYGIKIGELKTYKKDKIIASHYPQGIVGSNTTDNNIVGLANSSIAGRGDVILFRPNLSVFPSLKTWTDYLSNNPITVAYELTVPKIIPLIPQNITALPGLNNIWSNAEKVEIFGYANPLHIIEEQTATISNYETRIAALENAVINNN